ncbi:MAG: hypothetical protein ACFFBD_07125 [Candidatus Hodarchaeota archaeon]
MALDFIGIFTIIACIIGIVSFIFSLYMMWKILGLFPKEAKVKNYWYAAVGLVMLFLIGYLVAILTTIFELSELNRVMVPIVYLFGSFFVVIMVVLSYRTYKVITE